MTGSNALGLAALLVVLTLPATTSANRTSPTLGDAPRAEQQALAQLHAASAWPKRAVAVLRLERYAGAESRRQLVARLDDPAWQVRAFAVRALGRQRAPAGERWFATEQDPRVLRTALRHHYSIAIERLQRGVLTLARSPRLADRMLAAELAAASGNAELRDEARSIIRTIILRMSRHEAGGLSPRLTVLTGENDLHKAHRWRRWALKSGRSFAVRGGHAFEAGAAAPPVPAPPAPAPPAPAPPPSLIADLPPERFAAFVEYLGALGDRSIDLAICLDCTASMSGELTAAQGGLDDLLLFVGDVSGALRFGLVAYRDRHDRFETKAWDFTDDLATARQRLWSLAAEGGGDSRESVYDAMKLAVTRLSWREGSMHVLTVVGDAPPHVGEGAKCVELARHGAKHGLVTHVIQAENEPVRHFDAIAAAGGGQCVSLADDHRLIPEIVGLTLGETFGEEFRELFVVYLELCR